MSNSKKKRNSIVNKCDGNNNIDVNFMDYKLRIFSINDNNRFYLNPDVRSAYIKSMQFYPVVKKWGRKIRPHLDDPYLNRVLVRDFNKCTVGNHCKRFRYGQYPREFEKSDWILILGEKHRGRQPEYFKYVKHAACHWLVNFNLVLASLAEPKRPWRIITSEKHSTVWDGKNTIFDLNGLALFDGAPECFELAAYGPNAEVLAPGELRETGLPEVDFPREVVGLRVKFG